MASRWTSLHVGNLWSLSLIWSTWWNPRCSARVGTKLLLICSRLETLPAECTQLSPVCLPVAYASSYVSPRTTGWLVAQVGPSLSWLPIYVHLRGCAETATAKAGYMTMAVSMMFWAALIHVVRYTVLAGGWDPSGHVFMVGLQLACLWTMRYGSHLHGVTGTRAGTGAATATTGQTQLQASGEVSQALSPSTGGLSNSPPASVTPVAARGRQSRAGSTTSRPAGSAQKPGSRSTTPSSAGRRASNSNSPGRPSAGRAASKGRRSSSVPALVDATNTVDQAGRDGASARRAAGRGSSTAARAATSWHLTGPHSLGARLSQTISGLPRWSIVLELFLWTVSITTGLFHHTGSEIFAAWILVLPAMALCNKVHQVACEQLAAVAGQQLPVVSDDGAGQVQAGGASGRTAVKGRSSPRPEAAVEDDSYSRGSRRSATAAVASVDGPISSTAAATTVPVGRLPLPAVLMAWWWRVACMWTLGAAVGLTLAFTGRLDKATGPVDTPGPWHGLSQGQVATVLETVHDAAVLAWARHLLLR